MVSYSSLCWIIVTLVVIYKVRKRFLSHRCPWCSCKNSTSIVEDYGPTYVRCNSCGVVWEFGDDGTGGL